MKEPSWRRGLQFPAEHPSGSSPRGASRSARCRCLHPRLYYRTIHVPLPAPGTALVAKLERQRETELSGIHVGCSPISAQSSWREFSVASRVSSKASCPMLGGNARTCSVFRFMVRSVVGVWGYRFGCGGWNVWFGVVCVATQVTLFWIETRTRALRLFEKTNISRKA